MPVITCLVFLNDIYVDFCLNLCWGSTSLPCMSMSQLISGTEFSRPACGTRNAVVVIAVLVLDRSLHICLRSVFWKPTITTQRQWVNCERPVFASGPTIACRRSIITTLSAQIHMINFSGNRSKPSTPFDSHGLLRHRCNYRNIWRSSPDTQNHKTHTRRYYPKGASGSIEILFLLKSHKTSN